MKDTSLDFDVIETLKEAVGSNSLPAAAREYATNLLRRLSSPVRVSVMGKPGSGKSELINMITRARVLPEGARFPTTEIAYGAHEKITVTDHRGANRDMTQGDLSSINSGNAAFVRIETPAETLKRISLLEVVTDGTVAEFSAAIKWAIRRTDIALWCTQEFDDEERALWRTVPDSVKDHGFLVLSKADTLSASGTLSRRINVLGDVVAEEFHSLHAVATLQALRAFGAGDAVDKAAFKASGGATLVREITTQAEQGRRADFDSAHLFIARYKIPSAKPASLDKTINPAPEVKFDETETEAEVTPATETVETAQPVNTPRKTSRKPSVRPPAVSVSLPDDAKKRFADGVRFLRRRGESLLEQAANAAPGETGAITENCLDALEHLTDLFSSDDSGAVAIDNAIDDMTEASEMVILMQVEDGDAPAADAVTILLQLRREMETKLAA